MDYIFHKGSRRLPLEVVVYVEPEISSLVLILYLVCKLYESHLTNTMTAMMKSFCHTKISDKIWKQ